MIMQLNSVGHRSTNVLNLTKQQFQVRLLLAEIVHKHWVTNLKTLWLCLPMTLLMGFLMLLNSSRQVRSYNVEQ